MTDTERSAETCAEQEQLPNGDGGGVCAKDLPCPDHPAPPSTAEPIEGCQCVDPCHWGVRCVATGALGVCASCLDGKHTSDNVNGLPCKHPTAEQDRTREGYEMLTYAEFVAKEGNYQPDEAGIYGKLGRALLSWRRQEEADAALRDGQKSVPFCPPHFSLVVNHPDEYAVGCIQCERNGLREELTTLRADNERLTDDLAQARERIAAHRKSVQEIALCNEPLCSECNKRIAALLADTKGEK